MNYASFLCVRLYFHMTSTVEIGNTTRLYIKLLIYTDIPFDKHYLGTKIA